jgi:hypothetical protein
MLYNKISSAEYFDNDVFGSEIAFPASLVTLFHIISALKKLSLPGNKDSGNKEFLSSYKCYFKALLPVIPIISIEGANIIWRFA